jgi:hypothetical protein
MPNLFRTSKGMLRKPTQNIPCTLADGTNVEGIWGGSAKEEKLDWWLRKPGFDLTQSEEVAEFAIKSDKTDEIHWGAAPVGARLLFVLEAAKYDKSGRKYRLAKMVTTAANPAQNTYFHHPRLPFLGQSIPTAPSKESHRSLLHRPTRLSRENCSEPVDSSSTFVVRL